LPVNVIGFDASYCAGNEWCERAGSAAVSKSATKSASAAARTLAIDASQVLNVVFRTRFGRGTQPARD
jgi:hypothetical protein